MVAYSFQKRFVGHITAGLEPGPWLPGMKRHTLRRPRADGRHARPEQPLQLYTAMRTKHCRKIGNAVARVQLPVVLMLRGGRLMIARRAGPAPRSHVAQLAPIVQEILGGLAGKIFDGEAMDEFARTDGFADAAAMAAFFDPPERNANLDLVLIGWAPLP